MEVMQIVLMRKYTLLKNREIKISNSTEPFHNVSWFVIANCCWQFVWCKFHHNWSCTKCKTVYIHFLILQ